MKLLVTGGAGYIGSVVTAQLLRAGHEVTVLDDLSTGHANAIPDGASLIEGSPPARVLIVRPFSSSDQPSSSHGRRHHTRRTTTCHWPCATSPSAAPTPSAWPTSGRPPPATPNDATAPRRYCWLPTTGAFRASTSSTAPRRPAVLAVCTWTSPPPTWPQRSIASLIWARPNCGRSTLRSRAPRPGPPWPIRTASSCGGRPGRPGCCCNDTAPRSRTNARVAYLRLSPGWRSPGSSERIGSYGGYGLCSGVCSDSLVGIVQPAFRVD